MNIFKWPWPLTFIWPWPWDWPLTLTIKKKLFQNLWFLWSYMRQNVKSYVKSETTYRMRPSTRNIFQPTRSLYDFRFKSYGSKDDFHGYWCVWPWPWRINPLFCKLHRRGPSNMCVNIEKNRLKIDDFRIRFLFFINSTISHWLTYKIMQITKWPWLLTLRLTFDLDD